MDKGIPRVNKAVKCDTCAITLNSEQQAQQHYSGKNHLKKLRGIGSTTAQSIAEAVSPTSSSQDYSDPKLDPVSQAVYDNVLGKLPLKRKKEIPCTPCGMLFNSDAQATAHFTGSKHGKRQKVSDGSDPEESSSHVDDNDVDMADQGDTNQGSEPGLQPEAISQGSEAISQGSEPGLQPEAISQGSEPGLQPEDSLHQGSCFDTPPGPGLEPGSGPGPGPGPSPGKGPSDADPPSGPAKKKKKESAESGYCEICKLAFDQKTQLQIHLQGTKHLKKVKLQETADAGLGEGINAKSWGVAYSCFVCNVTLNAPDQLKQHKLETDHIENEKKYCRACDLICATVFAFDLHRETEDHKTRYIEKRLLSYCELCDQQLASPQQLAVHQRGEKHLMHYPSDNVWCTVCNIQLKTIHSLEVHKKGPEHAVEFTKIYCKKCEKQMMSLEQWNNHLKGIGHKTFGEVMCLVCDIIVVTKRQLAIHTKTPEHKAMYTERCVCEMCDVKLPSPRAMELHKSGKTHIRKLAGLNGEEYTDQPKYSGFCGICDLDLTSVQHFELHTNGKQHKMKLQRQTRTHKASVAGDGVSTVWTEIDGHEAGWLHCQTCNISVRTGMCLQKHIKSMKHKNNVAMKKTDSETKKSVAVW